MTLREQRCLFTRLLGMLIDYAFVLGYECCLEEVKRSPEQAAANAKAGIGIKNSLHLIGLAADINLYKDGVYITNGTGHAELGKFWKALHPSCAWGGEFSTKDYGHYSSTRDGVR